jgi:hypothetical protein
MKQPIWALPSAGGAAALGLAAALVSAYKVADCIRYQRAAGQCVPVVQAEALQFMSGLGAAIGPMAGFMVYNRKLERPCDEPKEQPKEKVDPSSVVLAPPFDYWADDEEKSGFRGGEPDAPEVRPVYLDVEMKPFPGFRELKAKKLEGHTVEQLKRKAREKGQGGTWLSSARKAEIIERLLDA